MPAFTWRRAVVVVVALVALMAGYRWWTSPERQIRRLLADVASILSHDEPQSDIRAIGSMAALQRHLLSDVVVQLESSPTSLRGRQEVIAMAASMRASQPVMHVRFFDPVIRFADSSSATTETTAQLTIRDVSGQDLADAYHVSLTLRYEEGRWAIAMARIRTEGGATE